MATVILALSAPTAGARPTLIFGTAPEADFELSGTNGYSIQVGGYGREVSLSVNRGLAFASYTAHGHVSTERITARLGSRGRISVEFRPSRDLLSRKKPPRGCTGRDKVKRSGVFVGTIRFVGERGYTEVDAIRARGSTVNAYRWKCRPSAVRGASGLEPSREPQTVLEAKARDGIEFAAIAEGPPEERGITWFFAGSHESRGRLEVWRLAFGTGRERTFVFDEAFSSATVTPPKPFEGTGVFLVNPDGSRSWTGSLTVSFPGAEDVALTGSRFKARLTQPETLAQISGRSAGWGTGIGDTSRLQPRLLDLFGMESGARG